MDGYCTDCENCTTIHNGRCGCGSGRIITEIPGWIHIPDDVMRAALAVVDDINRDASAVPSIARAILAERERCAKIIAEDYAEAWGHHDGSGPIARTIAAAIRIGGLDDAGDIYRSTGVRR